MDKAILRRVEKQAWFQRYPRGFPTLLFALTLIATIVAVTAIERADAHARHLELENTASEIAAKLEQQAAEDTAYLRAAAAFLSSRDEVSTTAFSEFAASLNDRQHEYGASGLGWARLLKANAIPALTESLHRQGLASFSFHPPPRHDTDPVVPIIYLEPETDANHARIGFDLNSEQVRHAALDRAASSFQPAVTGRVQLGKETAGKSDTGFLILVPVVENRAGKKLITGFVFSPIEASAFLAAAVQGGAHRQIDAAIYDKGQAGNSLLASHEFPGQAGITVKQDAGIGDRDWVLTVSDKKPKSLTGLAKLTLLFGLIVAAMSAGIARMITRRAAEDRRVLEWLTNESAIRTSLTRELNHRVKNSLANVLAILSLTRRHAKDVDDFAETLTGRIRALSATHDLLSQSDWSDASVDEIVQSEVAPYIQVSDNQISIDGPPTRLAPNDALSLGLAIHELATNAAKYGALSTPDGRVTISWKLSAPDTLEFNWREAGGPPVETPQKRGFGMDLLERVIAQDLRGPSELHFEPTGVSCRLLVPVRARKDFTLRSDN